MAATIKGEATKERFIATFIDNLIALFGMFIVVMMVPERFPVLKIIAMVIGYLGYFFVFETLWGRTIGKYYQGLIVRRLDGGRPDWKSVLIRTILRVVEVNPALFGGIPAGLIVISSERKQRLGDILAGTLVVSDKLKWDTVK